MKNQASRPGCGWYEWKSSAGRDRLLVYWHWPPMFASIAVEVLGYAYGLHWRARPSEWLLGFEVDLKFLPGPSLTGRIGLGPLYLAKCRLRP